MRFDKFTAKLQSGIADAQSLAIGHGHNQLEPGHLLLALLDARDNGIKALVQRAGGDAERLRDTLTGHRSEEHTSELQSRPHLVCRLLLEKKKKQNQKTESSE